MPTAPPTTQPQRLGLLTAGLLLPGSAGGRWLSIAAALYLLALAVLLRSRQAGRRQKRPPLTD